MALPDSPDFSLRTLAWGIYGPSALFGLSQGAMLPVIAISAIARGADEATASLVVALIGIGSLITNIPSGAITTRFGERRSMVAAAALTALGLGLCVIPAGLSLFALGVFLVGSASSVFLLARQSYLTEAVPAQLRARALSTLGGVQRIGVFVGPFVSALLIQVSGVEGAYFLALAAIVAAGGVALTVPDLVHESRTGGAAPQKTTTLQMLRDHWRTFAFLGSGILLLSAIRATRQVVVPLWATHIGLLPAQSSLVYGISGAIDAAVFYPAGYVMDRWGRKWIALPCVLVLGISFVLMPLTHDFVGLSLVAIVMGLGNGIGSGIVNTLGSDASPPVGRPIFLGLWREVADGGSSLGPLLLSIVTGIAGLATGIVVSGFVGFAAAAALGRWIPPHRRAARPSPRA